MLRPLSLTGFRVILFPSEACLHPFVVNGLDEVKAEFRVKIFGKSLRWSGNFSIFLFKMLAG